MSAEARTAEDTTPAAAGARRPFQVGLLGHGTVGGAFAGLLDERADEIERFNGRRPVICGVLTRSRGDFEQILADSDLLVEVMGGIEPARECLLRALRGGKHVVTANKQLLSQHGEELFETAREHDVRLRFEAAVAGAVPVVRVLEESLSATPIERDPRDRQRHDQLHPLRDGRRQELRGGARRGPARGLRRGRSVGRRLGARRGGEDGDPGAPGVRLAGAPRRGPLRGHRPARLRRPGVRARARPRAEAGRHGRAPRRRSVGARAPDVPLLGAPAGVGRRARSTR